MWERKGMKKYWMKKTVVLSHIWQVNTHSHKEEGRWVKEYNDGRTEAFAVVQQQQDDRQEQRMFWSHEMQMMMMLVVVSVSTLIVYPCLLICIVCQPRGKETGTDMRSIAGNGTGSGWWWSWWCRKREGSKQTDRQIVYNRSRWRQEGYHGQDEGLVGLKGRHVHSLSHKRQGRGKESWVARSNDYIPWCSNRVVIIKGRRNFDPISNRKEAGVDIDK